MEKVEMVAAHDIVVLQAEINKELRQLDGKLIDIKYGCWIHPSGRENYSAMILYKKN